ncbi:MAG: alpha-1,6-glucosidase, partial [Burkholderiales bacterium PBB4]
MQRSALTLISLFWSAHVWATSAMDADALAACNAPGFQTVLQAAPARPAAPPDASPTPQAVWLNRNLLQWPQAQPQGSFKLFYSGRGQLQVEVGKAAAGFDGFVTLAVAPGALPEALATRFKYVKPGVVLGLPAGTQPPLAELLRQQVLVAQVDAQGIVTQVAATQLAGALDDLYAAAGQEPQLGATPLKATTRFKLWAPTAHTVTLCDYPNATADASRAVALQRDAATGIWHAELPDAGQGHYYTYLVDAFVPGVGLVRNRVTDPYSVSLNADSKRSYIADLNSPALKPAGWDRHNRPKALAAQVDMTVYELHVRDFSLQDASVPEAHRGKYLAFTHTASNGMRHLRKLAQAGITDVHLLPVFDLATVPEQGCVSPTIATPEPGDSTAPQAATQAVAATDCFNWGYDPFHFNAPEGSYAPDAQDGAKRVIELRRMVMALHTAGLRGGMDMVYNHTTASGQVERAVLDRTVPGYYQRLDALGNVERSTCCDNTATENLMMAKLMLDSVELWTRHYRMDSYRFDLMAHQPREAMVALQKRVNQAAGQHVTLIGEG